MFLFKEPEVEVKKQKLKDVSKTKKAKKTKKTEKEEHTADVMKGGSYTFSIPITNADIDEFNKNVLQLNYLINGVGTNVNYSDVDMYHQFVPLANVINLYDIDTNNTNEEKIYISITKLLSIFTDTYGSDFNRPMQSNAGNLRFDLDNLQNEPNRPTKKNKTRQNIWLYLSYIYELYISKYNEAVNAYTKYNIPK